MMPTPSVVVVVVEVVVAMLMLMLILTHTHSHFSTDCCPLLYESTFLIGAQVGCMQSSNCTLKDVIDVLCGSTNKKVCAAK